MSTDISGGPYFKCRKCGVGVNSIVGDFCLLCWNASGGRAIVTDDAAWRMGIEARLSALEAAGKVPVGAECVPLCGVKTTGKERGIHTVGLACTLPEKHGGDWHQNMDSGAMWLVEPAPEGKVPGGVAAESPK